MKESSTSANIRTVTGWITPGQAGVTDAHNHTWIDPVPGTAPGAPTLNDRQAIAQELADYHQAGGGAIVDCQPGGCGRNGRVLHWLSKSTDVQLIACTGYHLRKYYPQDYWLFDASIEGATEYFLGELREGLVETREETYPVYAGFIKIACQATLDESPLHLMEAAVNTQLQTNVAIEVHTEKGSQGVQIAQILLEFGLSPDKLVLCHVDKLPDYGFHYELLSAGITLEYDTFFRPKYHPEEHLWPLLKRVIAVGFEDQIVVATDLAEAILWKRLGNGPGLTGLVEQIIPRMERIGFEPEIIQKLVGGNISKRLARRRENHQ